MSRRNGIRNRFEMDKNYLVPLICIVITCITIITCIVIVININSQLNQIKNQNSLNQYVNENTDFNITDEEKLQINKLISFLISNLDTSKDLTSENTKFNLVTKYYLIDNNSNTIPNENISEITPEVYRNLGYVYFDDYKEDYQYISEQAFKSTYQKLFNIEKYNKENYSDYYISSLNGYVIPKYNEVNESTQYKLNQVNIDSNNKNQIIVNMVEINLYRLYETMTLEEINDYLNKAQINKDSLTGNILSVKMVKQNDIYVFNGYGGI